MRVAVLLLLSALALAGAEPRAKNVVLFIADAMGVATLNAASIYTHGRPHSFFFEQMPNMALQETSTASEWVTDSAASMSAIVTGVKTHNGVISMGPDTVRRQKDGTFTKTILEYAEEHGLATGVVTNSPVVDATPAACYAHANDRGKAAEIMEQVWKPRFGDGVDVVIGPGRRAILRASEQAGIDPRAALGTRLLDSLDGLSSNSKRPVVLLDDESFDLAQAAQRAVEILSEDPDGFFLMVESNSHTDVLLRGLARVAAMDEAVRRVSKMTNAADTLIIVTADHSYDFRLQSGRRGEPIIAPDTDPSFGQGVKNVQLPHVRRDDTHTAEDVVVFATGPGAERVHGLIANTDIFQIMLSAYGWQADQ